MTYNVFGGTLNPAQLNGSFGLLLQAAGFKKSGNPANNANHAKISNSENNDGG